MIRSLSRRKPCSRNGYAGTANRPVYPGTLSTVESLSPRVVSSRHRTTQVFRLSSREMLLLGLIDRPTRERRALSCHESRCHADERIVVKSAIDDSGCTSTGADTKGLRAKREASAALARTRQPAPVNQCQPGNAAEHGRLRRHADPLGGQVLHIVVGVMRRSGWRLSRSGW
jgi:hypothetical protein